MGVPEDDVAVAQPEAGRDLAHRAQAGASQLGGGDLGAQRPETGAVERCHGEREGADHRPPA